MTNPEPAEAVQYPFGSALLQLCLEQATVFPENHDQRSWFALRGKQLDADGNVTTCGSTGCLAGHAVALGSASAMLVDVEYFQEERYYSVVDVVAHGQDGARLHYVGDYAQALLDLTDADRRFMFDADRTLDELWEYAEQRYPGEVVRPDAEQIEKIRAEGPLVTSMFSRLVPEDEDSDDFEVIPTSAVL